MPARQVYGKRTTKAAFQISTVFSDESPDATNKSTRAAKSTKATVKARSTAQDSDDPRRPLRPVRLNACLQALSLEEKPSRPNIKIRKAKIGSINEPKHDLSEPNILLRTNVTAIGSPNSSPVSSVSVRLPSPVQNQAQHISPTRQSLQTLRDLNDDLLLTPASMTAFRSFSDWGADIESHFGIDKIAEATYGEVYRLRLDKEHPSLSSNDESVLKVIALRSPTAPHKGRAMTTMDSVTSEVQLLQRMTPVPGFVSFREITIVRGRPCKFLVSAWKVWNKSRPKSERSQFPDPSRKASYSDDQLWAIIEMQDAGIDLEQVKLPTIFHVWDVFWNVALSLAKAEQECQFEHRDLHLGNICVRDRAASSDHSASLKTVTKPPRSRRLGYTSLETTIIDYTLSRATLSKCCCGEEQDNFLLNSSDAEVAYLDLANDSEIFEGDAELDYQYEIYRMMRSAMETGDPSQHIKTASIVANDAVTGITPSWQAYKPLTNLIWLHYVLQTLLQNLAAQSESEDAIKAKRANYPVGAKDASLEKSAIKLERCLRAVQTTLDVKNMASMVLAGFASAGDLIWLALEERWLKKDDVIGLHT